MDKEHVACILHTHTHTHTYTHTHRGILFSLKQEGNLPFATTGINLEDSMLSEINQAQKDKCHMTSLISGMQKQRME